MDIMQNSVTFFSTLELKYTNFKKDRTKVKISSALFCLKAYFFGNKIVLCTLGGIPGSQERGVPINRGKQRLMNWTPGSGPPRGPPSFPSPV